VDLTTIWRQHSHLTAHQAACLMVGFFPTKDEDFSGELPDEYYAALNLVKNAVCSTLLDAEKCCTQIYENKVVFETGLHGTGTPYIAHSEQLQDEDLDWKKTKIPVDRIKAWLGFVHNKDDGFFFDNTQLVEREDFKKKSKRKTKTMTDKTDTLSTKERTTLLEIANDLRLQGISVDEDTIKKWLSKSNEYLPDDWKAER